MTITARDVYDSLSPRVGYPPIRAQDIDYVVRVLNTHCLSAVTVRDPSVLALPGATNAAANPRSRPRVTGTKHLTCRP